MTKSTIQKIKAAKFTGTVKLPDGSFVKVGPESVPQSGRGSGIEFLKLIEKEKPDFRFRTSE